MTTTIIPVSETKQIRWTGLVIDDITRTITVHYNLETISALGLVVESSKLYQTIGEGYEAWDAQLGEVIRGAIVSGIKSKEGIV